MAEPVNNPDLELMLAYDGEGEAPVAPAADAVAKREALASLGEALRDTIGADVEAGLANDPFDAMWARIEHKITANGAARQEDAALEAAPVVTPSGASGASGASGPFGSIAAWFDRFRSQVAVGAMCAAAAAILVWFVRPPEKTIEYVEVRTASTEGANGARTMPVALQSQPAEVESLEVYDGSGVVLTIPSDDDDSPTTVIWLTPPESAVEGPI